MLKTNGFRYVSYSKNDLVKAIRKLIPLLSLKMEEDIEIFRVLDYAIVNWFTEYMSKEQVRTMEEHFDLGVLLYSAYTDVHSKECKFKFTEN